MSGVYMVHDIMRRNINVINDVFYEFIEKLRMSWEEVKNILNDFVSGKEQAYLTVATI